VVTTLCTAIASVGGFGIWMCATNSSAGCTGGSVCKPEPGKAGGGQRFFRGSFSRILLFVACALTPNTSSAAPHSALGISAGTTISGGWKDSAIAALGTVVLVLMVFTCVRNKRTAPQAAGSRGTCNCVCDGCRKCHEPTEVVVYDVEVSCTASLISHRTTAFSLLFFRCTLFFLPHRSSVRCTTPCYSSSSWLLLPQNTTCTTRS
jgi:hypothetical protein